MKQSWTKVFSFTFRHCAGSKGYLGALIAVSVILIAFIPGGMLLADNLAGDRCGITRAVTAGDCDISYIAVPGAPYEGVMLDCAPDAESAIAACAGDSGAVAIVFEENEITVVVPDDSGVTMSEAEVLAAYLSSTYPLMQVGASDEMADELALVSTAGSAGEEADDGEEMIVELIGMLVPYLVVMLMYFMVLIYGQSVANSAIMEKTSRLMDLFLVSVKPSHMMLGKVLATSAAGLLQALAWIFSAVAGCRLGIALVEHVNPDTTMGIIGVFREIGMLAGMFEMPVLITCAFVIIAGFVLYCSLAGIGGALASKPEELSSTNYLFTMILIISFFACLFTGGTPGMISEAPLLAYIPFTAVMVVPGRLLTGAMTAYAGLASAAITFATAVAVMIISGKVYRAMAFYRGKPINPIKLIRGFISR